jgi:general secretion pathway protein G
VRSKRRKRRGCGLRRVGEGTVTESPGFSLLELLVVVAIIGIVATIATPHLMDALDRGRQRRTMADMRSIATANGMYRVDRGCYADVLVHFEGIETTDTVYLQSVPLKDAWGTPFVYSSGGTSFALTSLGSDGVAGPAAPANWMNAPYEPDLKMTNGLFTQAPTAASPGGS